LFHCLAPLKAQTDFEKCKLLAEIFEITLDDLVNYDKENNGLPIPSKGKHAFGLITVGDKGQIGIAILKESDFLNMVNALKNQ
jgi:hypothetical protein